MNLKQISIYLYYNAPCLLSYIDEDKNYYLAVWVEDPDLYLVSRVCYNDLLKLEQDKELKTRYLFIRSKYNYLYNSDSKIVKKIKRIPEDYLPLI